MHSLRNAFALIVFVLFSSFFTVYAQQIQITDPTLETPEEYRISHVRVQGNQSTRTQFIINTSGLVEGKVITYPGDDIPNAINRLFQVGLFSDVMTCWLNNDDNQILSLWQHFLPGFCSTSRVD